MTYTLEIHASGKRDVMRIAAPSAWHALAIGIGRYPAALVFIRSCSRN